MNRLPADASRGRLVAPLALLLLASSCGRELDPCFGLQLNEALQVRVVGEYSEAAGYDFSLDANGTPAPCPAALKLPAQATLQLAVAVHEETNNLSCLPNTADVTGGSGLALGQRAPWVTFGTEDDAEIVHATHELTLDGCRGRWALSVESRATYGEHGDAFLPAPSSGYPPIVMHTAFQVDDRGSAACSQLITDGLVCYEYYVVELSRP
jgi:hypothetical protein